MNLVIRDLSKTYPNGTHALRGVSVTIPTGMFGLLGPNGAGKSTLMRILATLQEADTGSVSLGEIDVLREKEEVRRVLGYLPQEFGLYPKVSADELLDHFALLKGITDRRRRRATVDHLLHQTNLFAARHKRLGGFSGGMRQRFGIAVALLGNPRLIIVDEPTAGLDPAERVRFLNLLSELGENAVVILSTHIVEDVSELCSRMAIIDRGQILLEAEPLAATERLRGRVWRRVVERAEVVAFEERFQVISTRLLSGRTVIRVVAPEAPDATFAAVEPDLEDVYFATMRRIPLDAPVRQDGPSGDAGVPPAVVPAAASDRPPSVVLASRVEASPSPDDSPSLGDAPSLEASTSPDALASISAPSVEPPSAPPSSVDARRDVPATYDGATLRPSPPATPTAGMANTPFLRDSPSVADAATVDGPTSDATPSDEPMALHEPSPDVASPDDVQADEPTRVRDDARGADAAGGGAG